MRRLLLLGLSLLLLTLTTSALAGTDDSAQALFKQGLKLFNNGDIAAACNKFEKSYRLEAAGGTLFNLATCHEREGHYWKARGEFLKLESEMKAAGKTDKAELAHSKASETEAHLPSLVLHFPAASNVGQVMLDGKALDRSEWHSPVPVQTGSHVLTFSAPGLQQQRVSVQAGTGGEQVKIDVPILKGASTKAAPAPAAPPRSAAPPPNSQAPAATSWWTGKRVAGAVIGGAGVVAIGVGAVFGLEAISKKHSADTACGRPNGNCIDQSHADQASNKIGPAQTAATVSTVTFGVGVAALAAGSYLLVTGAPPSGSGDTAGVVAAPVLGPHGGGLSLEGRF